MLAINSRVEWRGSDGQMRDGCVLTAASCILTRALCYSVSVRWGAMWIAASSLK